MTAARRSRLKVGIDVPWVTSWSEETIGNIGPCPSVGGQAAVLQLDRAEYGRPIYSRNHFRRQRESVRRMLCPMCGLPTRSGDRWSQTGKYLPAGVMRARGLADSLPPNTGDAAVILDAGAISPGHHACMQRSLEQCPHLAAATDRELKPFPDIWQVVPMLMRAVVRPRAAGGPSPAATTTITAIGFLQMCGRTAMVDREWRRLLEAPA